MITAEPPAITRPIHLLAVPRNYKKLTHHGMAEPRSSTRRPPSSSPGSTSKRCRGTRYQSAHNPSIHPPIPPPFSNPPSNICHCRCTEAHRAGTSAKGCRWRITALGIRAPRNRLWGPGNTLYTNSLCTNFLGNQITFVAARIASADAQGRRSCDVQAGYHRGSSFSQQRSLILNLACC